MKDIGHETAITAISFRLPPFSVDVANLVGAKYYKLSSHFCFIIGFGESGILISK
jgi:hypothetical protein